MSGGHQDAHQLGQDQTRNNFVFNRLRDEPRFNSHRRYLMELNILPLTAEKRFSLFLPGSQLYFLFIFKLLNHGPFLDCSSASRNATYVLLSLGLKFCP